MRVECHLRVTHHLGRQILGDPGVDTPALVDVGQLAALPLRTTMDLGPLQVQLPLHQLGLGPHRDVLAGGHREGPTEQAGEAGQPDDS